MLLQFPLFLYLRPNSTIEPVFFFFFSTANPTAIWLPPYFLRATALHRALAPFHSHLDLCVTSGSWINPPLELVLVGAMTHTRPGLPHPCPLVYLLLLKGMLFLTDTWSVSSLCSCLTLPSSVQTSVGHTRLPFQIPAGHWHPPMFLFTTV